MDFQAILTMIVTIINMILQMISGGTVIPTPGPEPEFPQFAEVRCDPVKWVNNNSNDMYTSGTMTKECDVHLDMVTISGRPIVERMQRFVQGQIESVATPDGDGMYYTRSDSQQAFNGTVTVPAGEQEVRVGGAIQLMSDMNQFLRTRFSATSLPKSGNGQFLKALRTDTQVDQSNLNTFRVKFSTFSTVLRPWFTTTSQFRPALLNKQRQQMDKAAANALRELLWNL